ncbi:hypothetical protein BJF79_27995 [Actinomadura sp. CNU-125]|uniref:TetR family transcriptional regulator n=1 Tax=Actinomadura sp. CNU-125 TaxID=1904961 RepID=UPI0009655ADD|nr:TetR family transcriptional regulator [Actinomadura sp. CNU-125]OLT38049.1 hypothetical protein BJF79_27995 [Actinomadura sp. CNU-125]
MPGAGAHRTGTGGGGPAARRDRGEQTREALLAAAERLWAERGIHGASLDDVAAAAGLTKGAVYSNFTGKTDLLLALLDASPATASARVPRRPALPGGGAGGGRGAGTGRGRPRGARVRPGPAGPDAACIALLLVEFWLYGMRDYAAGWRVADWYAERRARLAAELPAADGIDPDDRAALAVALDVGLAFQHLLDPDRVPAALYDTARELVQRPAPP